MKNTIFFYLLLGVVVLVSFPQISDAEMESPKPQKMNVGYFAALGVRHLTNKDINDNLIYSPYQAFRLGINYQLWTFLGELAKISNTTGNETLETVTDSSLVEFGVHYSFVNWSFSQLFLSVSFGAQWDEVRYSLYGDRESLAGRSDPVAGVGVGIKSPMGTYFYYSVESQMRVGEKLDPYPGLGINLSLGLQL
jgi:hypothetical protein